MDRLKLEYTEDMKRHRNIKISDYPEGIAFGGKSLINIFPHKDGDGYLLQKFKVVRKAKSRKCLTALKMNKEETFSLIGYLLKDIYIKPHKGENPLTDDEFMDMLVKDLKEVWI